MDTDDKLIIIILFVIFGAILAYDLYIKKDSK